MGHLLSRWWPQWNRFSISPTDGVMDFGAIQLFLPLPVPTHLSLSPGPLLSQHYPTPLVTSSVLLTSSPASSLLTATALLLHTYGTVFFPFAKVVGSFLLLFLPLLLGPVGSLALRASAPVLLEFYCSPFTKRGLRCPATSLRHRHACRSHLLPGAGNMCCSSKERGCNAGRCTAATCNRCTQDRRCCSQQQPLADTS
jgi:hypothetical protein